MNESPVLGCIVGVAVGDALGLPYEGLSRRRAARLLGTPDRFRFFFAWGMVSDDTEHTCMVAQALIAAPHETQRFQQELARRLRWWMVGLPAGAGLATLRASLRLWLGVSPERSGVFSAGNGPAMRSAILGAAADDLEQLRAHVRASSRLTHTDPKAEVGALAVALAAHLAARRQIVTGEAFLQAFAEQVRADGNELVSLLSDAVESVGRMESTETFGDRLGLGQGVTGYVYHTVPVCIHAWLAHPLDYRAAVTAVIRCGGDTDSTAAIVGGIVGATVGPDGIPEQWRSRLMEWPRTIGWMEKLGKQLAGSVASGSGDRPLRLPAARLMLRNVFFLCVVLFHGLRRLFPPF